MSRWRRCTSPQSRADQDAPEQFPALPQVACFDTAFHRDHDALADHYAIPHQLHAQGIRRYGFHGLSYEYIAKRLSQVAPDIAGGRVIVAHLGSGASMCAMKNGKSVESTWALPRLTGSRWERAPASSIPAWCCT
jgi:acetate kinase